MLSDENRKTESAYGFTISLQNIYQWRVIDGEGNIVGFRPDDSSIQRALSNAKFKLAGREFSSAVKPAADHFEWGRYAEASAALSKLRRVRKSPIKEDVEFLSGKMDEMAAKLMKEAESHAAAGRPYDAYLTYAKVITQFPLLSAAKDARKAASKLKRDKAVKRELLAMKNYEMAVKLMASKRRSDPPKGRALMEQISLKFRKTKAGAKAKKALE